MQFLYLEKHCVESTEIIHTLRETTDKMPGQYIATQPMYSGLNGNTVHVLTERLLEQAYANLLTCHISLPTKIHHNTLRNRLPVQLLAEYTN